MGFDRLFLFGTAVLALTGASARAQAPIPVDATTYARAADHYVTIDGARLRIRDEGDRKAPPIILVHGFSFSLESWDDWAADLARDHRVIRYDLAGHGLSAPDPKGRYGTLDRVHELRGLMNRLHIRKAVIAGNSFGGLVAWNFAALYPERVNRLILVDSAAFSINGVTERPVAVPAMMRLYLQAPSPAAVAGSAGAIFAHPERLSAERLALMRAMIARNGPALIAHLEQFTLPEPRPALARITAPTLILWGRADRVVPVAQAADLSAAIRASQLIIYDDVGHAPQEEASSRSIADVRTFLNNK
ncbi:Pimeloyl-ACP methyl ester carboxylesterase [Sphingomonas sp. YR710]|uniref:alpha/beta fold hydrolase n=1 Tax=Sphingomonas sp. YR710 TaxID=1882773 RepID=UPI00088ADC15|nr:alpha/beta hydrolase [Sphingomonas sp. YR710]SDD69117.1 Pimeloyl-ACP methyl ester carboxylesterase [Sphingomonas sp. YR710]